MTNQGINTKRSFWRFILANIKNGIKTQDIKTVFYKRQYEKETSLFMITFNLDHDIRAL